VSIRIRLYSAVKDFSEYSNPTTECYYMKLDVMSLLETFLGGPQVEKKHWIHVIAVGMSEE